MHSRTRPPRTLRWLTSVGLVSLLASFASCAELAPIASGVCGNSVIDYEIGEECDGSVSAEVRDACAAAGLVENCGARCAGPSEVGACRYVAGDGSTGSQCPVGWARGVDDICRRPSGSFEQLPFARVNGIALDGQIADFDGDGVNDLFLVGADRPPVISYFDASGRVVQSAEIPAANVASGFISADRADDPAADLIVPGGPAITTFRGSEGKQLLQKAYAPFFNPVPGARLFSLPVVPVSFVMGQVPPGFDRPLGREETEGNVKYREVQAATLQVVPDAELTFEGLAGGSISPPVFADLLDDGPGLEPLPALAEAPLEIIEASSSQIYIGKFPANAAPVQLIDAPLGETFQQIVPVHGGSETRVAVRTLRSLDSKALLRLVKREERFAQPPVTDPPTPPNLPNPPMLETAYELPPGPADEELLAVGFLNDDELPDIVTSAGVRFLVPMPGQTEPQYTNAYVTNFEPFETATVMDLNHDGRREIVTLTAAGDIVVLLPATNYTYTPVPIGIPDRARNLVTGDFDGDGFDDLLVASGDAPDCNSEDELYLLFGSASAVPAAPKLIGSLPGIEAVLPIRFYFPFQPDGVSDITIQTSCSASGDDGDFVGVFFGSTSRIVSSPFSPYTLKFTQDPTIERLTTGTLLAFDKQADPDGHDDIALVGSLQNDTDEAFYDREIRLVTVTGDAEMQDTNTTLRIVDGVAADIDDSSKLLDHLPAIATGQLFSGSAADEIVVLSAYRSGSGAKVTLWVAEVVDGELTSPFSADIDAPGIADFSFSRVRLFDYDDNGHLDVAAFIVQQGPDGASLATALFLNDGATLTPASLDLTELVFVFDFADLIPANCIGLPGCDDSRRFAAAGSTSVVTCLPETTTGCGQAVDAQLAGTLFVGDLDSDGLQDLGVVDLDGFQVFRQLSQSEAQAADP